MMKPASQLPPTNNYYDYLGFRKCFNKYVNILKSKIPNN